MEQFQNQLHDVFSVINHYAGGFIFWENHPLKMPLILCVLSFGGIFFTLRYKFVNFRFFKHAIDLIRGRYDTEHHKGQITHFQALTSAISATVGLGNIGGVAVAVSLGGPGCVFWMWIVGLLGMSLKFSCCSLGQVYRRFDENHHVLGGPMVYLEDGIREEFPRFKYFGKILGITFAILLIFASLGGGNMYQSNQSFEIIASQYPFMADYGHIVGMVLAVLVAVVIIGGIQRIGEVTSKLIPIMCGTYCLSCLAVIFSNYEAIPQVLMSIYTEAFAPNAIWTGGLMGIIIQGVKRASFSSEAGLGTSAVAHAAAKTDRPVKEGIVSILEPFIDTNIVCTMTSFAILITGAHLHPELIGKGAAITSKAFSSLGTFLPFSLMVTCIFFAYSTIISWGYYGEKAVQYLWGSGKIKFYRIIFVLTTMLGPILTLKDVLEFSDIAQLGLAFPNIIGMVILSGKLSKLLDAYTHDLKTGKVKPCA